MQIAPVRPHGMTALWIACVLGGGANSLSGTAGSLLADHAAGTPALAGLPQAVGVGGAALAAVLISRSTAVRGRRISLAGGAAAATVASMVAFVGAVRSDLVWLLIGSALLGAGNATVMLGRYAAADLVPERGRVRAMAAVLAVTTAGAVVGPNLLPVAGVVPGAGGSPLAGSYLVAALGYVLAAVALGTGPAGVLPPRPVPDPPAACRAPVPVAALAVLGTANLVMVGMATMAPVHLGHHDAPLAVIGLVVGLHVAAMFAPSPLSARLVERIGARPAAAVAGAVLLAAGITATTSTSATLAGMVLLGIGWNVALVSGSALLTDGVPAAERPRWEGRGEVVTGAGAVVGGAGSGLVMAGGGFVAVTAAAAVGGLVLLVPLVVRTTEGPSPTR